MELYKVVIVDDEKPIVEGLKAFINWEKAGFQVVDTALNGEEGVRKALHHHADVVLTDMRMPLLSGNGLIQKLHEELPDCAFIVLSGYNSFEYVQGAVNNGAVCYLLKPVQEKELLDSLQKIKHQFDKRLQMNLEMDDLRSRLDTLRSELLEHKLMELVTFPDHSRNQPEEIWKSLGLAYVPQNYYVMVAEPQCTDHESQVNRMLEQVCCYDDEKALSFPNINGQIVIIQEAEKNGSLHENALKWQNRIAEKTPGKVSLGISKASIGIEKLFDAYYEALRALEYKLIRGEGCIVFAEELSADYGPLLYPYQTENELLNALEAGKLSEAKKKLSSIFDFMTGSRGMTPKTLAAFSLGIGISLVSNASMHGIAVGELEDEFHFSIQNLMEMKTAQEMHGALENLLVNLSGHIRSERELQQKGVVGEIQKYVEEHYPENISLDFIEEKFFINASYLSFLFKKKTGVNFVDYLTNVRIEKAKKLLAKPELKIYEISELVGYNSPRYFSQLFEKKLGMTPTQYRQASATGKEM